MVKGKDKSVKDTISRENKNAFDPKEELLITEIEKYKTNIDHLKKLQSLHKKSVKDDVELKADLGGELLTNIVEKIKILEKELLIKKLELRLHQSKINKDEIVEQEEIIYSQYYPKKPKGFIKERLTDWQDKLISANNEEKDSIDKKEQFRPYKKDIFLRFTYDIVGKVIPYPFNCFILSLILIPFIIAPYYFVLGPESLYTSDSTVGALETTSFMVAILLIPLALIILHEIFKKYRQTFQNLRDVAKVSDEDYQEFISLTNWTLQSPSIYYLWIIAWSATIILVSYIYYNPLKTDILALTGSYFGLISLMINFLIIVTIVVSLTWYLLAIVRAIRRFTTMPLDIRPLDPDQAGGLKPLSQLSFNISLVSLLGVAGMLYALFFAGRSIYELTTALALGGLVAIMIILFLFPLSNAHNVMDKQKSEILKILSTEHALAYKRIKEEIPKAGPCINTDTLTELQGIAELYDRANSMPVWPFDFRTITNLVAVIGIPLVLIFLESLLFG